MECQIHCDRLLKASPAKTWNCRALIMSGGRSDRMRATLGTHKALVEVGGRSLLETNLKALLDEGFCDIAVAIGSHDPEIETFLADRGTEIAKQAGAAISTFKETRPLGTIGAVRNVAVGYDAVLVINVDNLTSLPLRKFVEHHRTTGAALTIASHREPFRIPFGQLKICDGIVKDYLEKPTLFVQISSGTYVVSREAAQIIQPEQNFDVTQLFAKAKANGMKISAFEHDCVWFDLNDEPALRCAQQKFVTEPVAR